MGPALSPATSFGSSASRQHLLDQALRLSSLRESSPSGVATVDSLRLFPACADVPAVDADDSPASPPAALFRPADGAAADGGAPDSDPSVWETVFLVPTEEAKQPWSIFEAGPMFAGEDELDAHAAAVLAAENDIDAMADAMEHAAAAVPLPSAVGGGAVAGGRHHAAASAGPAVFVPLEPARAEQPTLLGAPAPVIVVRRAGPMSELAGITTANSPAVPQRLDAGKGHFWGGGGDGCLPRIAAGTAPDSSLDSFETATGYDPPEMPGQGDWSADEREGSDASAPQTPRGGDDSDVEGGYGSEDEWTPACVRRTALRRRSRTSSSGGADARGGGSGSNSPQHGAVATEGVVEQLGRAAATRVRDIVRAFGSDDGDDDDDAGASPRQSTARRGGGGKRRRSPASAFESHDSDGNPRHKRHNPWCASDFAVAMCAVASMAGFRPSICRVADCHDLNSQPTRIGAIECLCWCHANITLVSSSRRRA